MAVMICAAAKVLFLNGKQVPQRQVEMALYENHFGPVAQMDRPVKVRLVNDDQGEGHERKGRHEAGAQEDQLFGPRPAVATARLSPGLQSRPADGQGWNRWRRRSSRKWNDGRKVQGRIARPSRPSGDGIDPAVRLFSAVPPK